MNPLNNEEPRDNNTIRGQVQDKDATNNKPIKSRTIYVSSACVRYINQKVKIHKLMKRITSDNETIPNEFAQEKNVASIVKELSASNLIHLKNSRYGSKGF